MRETLTATPRSGVALEEEPKVTRTAFGDGYELRAADNLNATAAKWSVRFIEGATRPVLAFLRRQGGVLSFNWTDPHGVAGVYVCRKWSCNHLGGTAYETSATFEQVFEA